MESFEHVKSTLEAHDQLKDAIKNANINTILDFVQSVRDESPTKLVNFFQSLGDAASDRASSQHVSHKRSSTVIDSTGQPQSKLQKTTAESSLKPIRRRSRGQSRRDRDPGSKTESELLREHIEASSSLNFCNCDELDNAQLTISFLVEGRFVGSFIGQHGRTVNIIEQETGTHIVCDKDSISMSQNLKRVCIRGSIKSITSAQFVLLAVIADRQNSLGEPVSPLVLFMPLPTIPFLIGKKGSNIQQVQKKSGATVQVQKKSDPRYSEHDKTVAINGTLLQKAHAQYLLMRSVHDTLSSLEGDHGVNTNLPLPSHREHISNNYTSSHSDRSYRQMPTGNFVPGPDIPPFANSRYPQQPMPYSEQPVYVDAEVLERMYDPYSNQGYAEQYTPMPNAYQFDTANYDVNNQSHRGPVIDVSQRQHSRGHESANYRSNRPPRSRNTRHNR